MWVEPLATSKLLGIVPILNIKGNSVLIHKAYWPDMPCIVNIMLGENI